MNEKVNVDNAGKGERQCQFCTCFCSVVQAVHTVLPAEDLRVLFPVIFWSPFGSFETGLYKSCALEGPSGAFLPVHRLQARERFPEP